MIKVLFIGKFNVVFEEIYALIQDKYNVQISSNEIKVLRPLLKMLTPDVIVVSLVGFNADHDVMIELKDSVGDTPCVFFGNEYEQSQLGEFRKEETFHVLGRPFSSEELTSLIDTLGANANSYNGVEGDYSARIEELEHEIDRLRFKLNSERNFRNPGMDKKCVLVIDDSPEQLKVLNHMLSDRYDVRVANGAMKAMKLIGKRRPDVILLDYEMPDIDGRKTLEMIREMQDTRNIPVVFLTGHGSKENVESVMELRPTAYLVKPASTQAIRETLKNILGQ